MKSKSATYYGPFYTVRFPGYITYGIYWRGEHTVILSLRSSAEVPRTVFDPIGMKHHVKNERDLFEPKGVE